MKYYDLKKRWQYIKPHLRNKKVIKTLTTDVSRFFYVRGYKHRLEKGEYPFLYESCDWYLDKKGRFPEYINYTLSGACHYLVRFNLKLAKLVEPDRNWRIISSNTHSTVWDGEDTIFEFNYYAYGIPAMEAFKKATENVSVILRMYEEVENSDVINLKSEETNQ
ncbi:MAG: hypothetical protein MUC73_01655 [Cyclobacteriaceae bacterium]|jgi:hypothetical protein|nr:hypothetical protein [Cyclobacteriaceae bacterium]